MAVIRKPKTIRIAFRATNEDGKMINALIEKTGMAGSDVIRLAIRRLHDAELEERAASERPRGRSSKGKSKRSSSPRSR